MVAGGGKIAPALGKLGNLFMSGSIRRLVANAAVVSGQTEPYPAGAALFSDQAWAEIARRLKLSGRELQVARGVFNDCKETAIASDLGISSHTVHTHVERLHHKLSVANRAQLLVRVMQEFLALTASPESTLPSICANRTAGRCPLRSLD